MEERQHLGGTEGVQDRPDELPVAGVQRAGRALPLALGVLRPYGPREPHAAG